MTENQLASLKILDKIIEEKGSDKVRNELDNILKVQGNSGIYLEDVLNIQPNHYQELKLTNVKIKQVMHIKVVYPKIRALETRFVVNSNKYNIAA